MKVLVTGAAGFLGRHVVRALLGDGHAVRALVRPSVPVEALDWPEEVEVFRADLRSHPDLGQALADVDAVVHLAAAMSGGDVPRFAETAIGTERLLDAMSEARVRRLVLCSSFSVYDWLSAAGEVDEGLPISPDVYRSGGYASAKLWQERLAERAARVADWQLTVLRPGFVWGAGNEAPAGSLGPRLGPLQVVLSPGRELPITHVENCADRFRQALSAPPEGTRPLNVVDGQGISAWRFAGELARHGGARLRLPVPHALMWPAVRLVHALARVLLGPRAKLPSLFEPQRFAQGYRPLRYSTRRLEDALGGRPPLDWDGCVARTWTR